MNPEKNFNPSNPEYKEVKDLPQERREEFVDVEGGFIRKEALEQQTAERREAESAQIESLRAEISGTGEVEAKQGENKNKETYENYLIGKESVTGISKEAWIKIDAYTEDILRERLKSLGSVDEKEIAKEVLFNSTNGFYTRLMDTYVKEGENGWAKVVDNGESIVGKTLDGTKVVFNGDSLIVKKPDGTSSITKSTREDVKKMFASEPKVMMLFADDGFSHTDSEKFPAAILEGYKSAQAQAMKKYIEEIRNS